MRTSMLCLTSVLLPALSSLACAQTVFVNELHYDNSGSDTGEAVEIAGPAGTDLTGWSLVFYNGSSSVLDEYGSITLNGTLPDQCNGFGTLTFAFAGIQNGAPDGLVLADSSGNVQQFLSYEGSFTAVGGIAAGLTSTDIGVEESSSTPVGESLQLIGSGSEAPHFSWVAPAAESFSAVNSGQEFGGECPEPEPEPEPVIPTAGQVFINEFHYDNAGSDSGEFVEIAAIAGAKLDGWQVELYNGNGGAPYGSISLSGTVADEGAGFGTLSFAQAGIQNGSPDGLALVDPGGNVWEFLSYEGSFQAVGGNADGMTSDDVGVAESSSEPLGVSLQRAGATGCTWVGPLVASPGSLNDGQAIPAEGCAAPVAEPPSACFDPATLIHDIQGSGFDSPLNGSSQTIEAIVVGDFQNGSGSLEGFFLQEEDGQVDADPATSEGIFVYDGSFGVDVAPGDLVRVTGMVDEFHGLTELTGVSSVQVCDQGLSVTPAQPTFPLADTGDLEAYEGMAVHFQQQLRIAEYYNYDRYGEMVLALPLAGDDRPYQPTAVVTPGTDAAARQQENELRRITLDDGLTSQNPAFLRHPNGLAFSPTNSFRGGDIVTDIQGVVNYSFGLYRIQPTAPASHVMMSSRSAQPDPVGGRLKVASFNVLNYFNTIDNGADICGPAANMECRGADSDEEFQRQRTKIIAALAAMDADIVGLIEIENNASASLQDLVQGLNDSVGAGAYAYVDTGTIGGDAIKVALIYKPATVAPSGPFATLDGSVDTRFVDDKNRPVLAQTFSELATAARFTVAVNHLKSKGSDCNSLGDPDAGDGQGNCNRTRQHAAAAQVDWLASDPTGSGDVDQLIIGDLNAYTLEDPINTILAGADDTLGNDDDFRNLIADHQGAGAYSYVFSGQFGYLDHALANLPLADQVTGVTEWHINADEPDALDYNTDFNPASYYAPDPFRSSDHDPVIVGLELESNLSDVLAYFEDALRNGTLEGTPRKRKGASRPERGTMEGYYRDLLQRALEEQAKGRNHRVCPLLRRAVQRSDGSDSPPDWVTGVARSKLSSLLESQRTAICGSRPRPR